MSSKDLKIRFDNQFCRMNCQIFSWPLSSGAWRELQERDVAWNLEGLGAMPPGLIEEENSVRAHSRCESAFALGAASIGRSFLCLTSNH
jgi:hypothetical protein